MHHRWPYSMFFFRGGIKHKPSHGIHSLSHLGIFRRVLSLNLVRAFMIFGLRLIEKVVLSNLCIAKIILSPQLPINLGMLTASGEMAVVLIINAKVRVSPKTPSLHLFATMEVLLILYHRFALGLFPDHTHFIDISISLFSD